MKYDIIVIGAGLAGLTASLKLAKSGKKVALFEKHSMPGGYATNFNRKNKNGNIYTFDVSLHSLSGTNENCCLNMLFNDLGIIDDITLLKKSEPSMIFKNNGKICYIPNSASEYKEVLIKNYPNYKLGIESLFNFIKDFYENRKDVIRGIDVPKYDTLFKDYSLTDFIKKYVNNDEFIDDFCYLWVYAGLPPSKLNSSYGFRMITSYIMGGESYIKGGSGQLTKIMKEHIEKHGSKVYLLSEIIKINTENDRVISVTTKKGETFEANEFIFACNPIHIFSLINNPIIKDYVENLNTLEKSTSITQLYVAIDCPTKEAGIKTSHTFFYNDTSNNIYNSFVNDDTKNLSFVLTAYDQLDPDLNKHGAYLNMAILDYEENWPERNTKEYKDKKDKITKLFLDKLIELYPKLKEHIQIVELGTPRTMQRYTNNASGSIYGWAQNLKQDNLVRPSFKTPFENAIMIGAWSYPGGGYEACMFSGFLGSNRILSKKNNKSSSKELIPIDTLLNGLLKRFNPENAEGLDITYKFIFEGYDPIYLEVKNQIARLLTASETPSKIDTILTTTHEVWQKISLGELSGQNALMDGLITCDGNLRNFASIPKIFNKVG